jgi:excisionase family DNA binding protein
VTGFLTIAEAGSKARVSPRTIRRALRAPRMPLRHYRIGRRVVIDESDLEQWVKAHAAMPVVAPAVLDRMSPIARELLAGFSTPAAPVIQRGCVTTRQSTKNREVTV